MASSLQLAAPALAAEAASAISAAPLLTITVDDLLVTALEAISTCEDFTLEAFLSGEPHSSEHPAALENFTLFPKLAAEIRLKIWAHAYANVKGRKVSIMPPLVKVPSLLQVCYDSRKMGLRIYTRHRHESLHYMGSFVTIIDFEKDTIDLTARGKFRNPQPVVPYADIYIHKTPTLDFAMPWRDNLLMYSIFHYSELCKSVEHLTLRSCYLSWLPRLQHHNFTTNAFSVEEVFKIHFPALKAVGILSNGVAETPEYIIGLTPFDLLKKQRQDSTLYRFLYKQGEEGRIKFYNIGSLNF